MSLRPIKVAVQYLLGAVVIAFFVSLLTFIFSFLGTIFCAALAGMMLGALKNLRWQSIPFSLLFPSVIVGLLRVTKAELPASQVLVLAFSAFGAFWLTYVAAAFLLAFERKNQPVPDVALVQLPATRSGPGEPESEPSESLVAAAHGAAPDREADLNLGVLEGKWLFEAHTNHQTPRRKVLEFRDDKLVLSVTEPSGTVSLFAECQVLLDGRGARRSMKLAGTADSVLDEFLVCI